MTTSSINRLIKHDKWPEWAKNWWHCLLVYHGDIRRTDLLKQASAMAYTTLFSLVPSIAGVFTLLGLFLPILGNHANLLDEARQFLFKNLATGSGTQVVDYLESFIAGLNLKKIGMLSFVIVLWTLISLLTQIEGALNRIWLVSQARPMLNRFIYFWLFLTLGMLGLSILIGISTSYSVTALITKKTLAVADSADDIPFVSMTFSWLMGCSIFFLVYKVVPNCNVENKPALRGAVVGGTLFYVLSKLYTVYAAHSSYKSVYGTLAAVPIFLLWIYVCWVIALAGALFAWRTQTGFPSRVKGKSIESPTVSIEHLRNHTIRTRLPLLALLTIYHRFSEGTGTGVSTDELVTRFHLPYSWVSEAVDILRELGLIIIGKPNSNVLIGGSDTDRWFPTQPAEKVAIDSFMTSLSEPVSMWFDEWEPSIPEKLKQVVVSNAAEFRGQNLQTILQSSH